MTSAPHYHPPRYFPPRYFPPGRRPAGANVVGMPPPRAPAEGVPISNLQLIEPVVMVPILVMADTTPAEFSDVSDDLSPVHANLEKTYILQKPPRAASAVEVTFEAVADLGATNEYVILRINYPSVFTGELFVSNGQQCPLTSSQPVTFPASEWNQWIADAADDNIRFRFRPSSAVNQYECTQTFIRVYTHYTEELPPADEPIYTIWRSEEPVRLGDGSMGYLEGQLEYDAVTGAFVLATPSATLNKVTLSGLNVVFDADGCAYLGSLTTFEKRGCVGGFSSRGYCIPW